MAWGWEVLLQHIPAGECVVCTHPQISCFVPDALIISIPSLCCCALGVDAFHSCMQRGIDVLMNKESKRETPAVVSFGDKMRFIGTDGAAKISMNPKNTPHQLKRLLGKQFKDPAVQADLVRLPFKITEGPDGGCLVHVTFCNEPASFAPEQLMAMVLGDLKKIAEVESGIPVTDCAISVPTFYTGGCTMLELVEVSLYIQYMFKCSCVLGKWALAAAAKGAA